MPSIIVGMVTFIVCALLLAQVESKAMFGIGMRIIGDQLLVKDVLQAPAVGLDESPTIGFNYAIPEPITYIEIFSEENVFAEVNFSYQHDLVKGTLTAINTTTEVLPLQSFEVLITIYGFNETMLNVNPAYILNRDQQFEGILEPQQNDEEDISDGDEDEEYLNLSNEDLDAFDNTHTTSIADDHEGSDELDASFEHKDKIIELGERQTGDHLIYETYQTSSSSTEEPANHSVVFYYIDSNFITCAKFVIFDHYEEKSATDSEYTPPIAEYSHYSPNTLKAIIMDQKATSLFVQMFLYGYTPTEVPVDYAPYMPTVLRGNGDSGATTESYMSPLQRLRALMNAEQHAEPTRETSTSHSEEAPGDELQREQVKMACDGATGRDAGSVSARTAAVITILFIFLGRSTFCLHFERAL